MNYEVCHHKSPRMYQTNSGEVACFDCKEEAGDIEPMTDERFESIKSVSDIAIPGCVASVELREAVAEIERLRSHCQVGKSICGEHAQIHGAEASELRARFERLINMPSGHESIENGTFICIDAMSEILEDVDARDSLMFSEAKDR